MVREKKVKINLYIEKTILKEIEKICDDPYEPLEDVSSFIRYCIKQQLPLLKKEREDARK